MPIPTRSVPARDPRKQPATVGHTVPTLKPPPTATQSKDESPSKTAASKTALSTFPTRRQSLIRPSQLKTPSSTKSTAPPTSTRTAGRGPTSSVKPDGTARQQYGRPPSPKKTEMPPPTRPVRSTSPVKPDGTTRQQYGPSPKKKETPPPTRPVRSTSLRQPPSSNSGAPAVPRGHARHQSQLVTPASKTLQTPSTATTTTPKSRNEFSTYQQQLSPKKTPKPPIPTTSVRAPSDQASSVIPSSWPEIAALQTELLQLTLLHKSEWQRNDLWERDAEEQLRNKYNSVARDYRAILDVEKESQRKLNGQALHCWLKNSREHSGQHGFAEQVLLLSRVAQEVYDISDNHGGRYEMVLLEFQSWLQRVEEVQEARSPHVEEQNCDSFINPIHREWKEDTNALIMKLQLASRQLQSLDILGYGEVEALKGSALLRTAQNLGDLVHQMVEELSIIRRIEADIVKSETTRVSQLAQQLVRMQPQEDPATPRTGLWTRTSIKS